jgi:hypothetical protein
VGTVQGASDVADIPMGNVTSLAVSLGGVPPRTYYVRVVPYDGSTPLTATDEQTVVVT